MLIGAGVSFALLAESSLRNESGREAGREIAAIVPAGSIVAADHAIEARPEVLWEVAASGSRVEWKRADDWPSTAFVLARGDAGSDELALHQKARATLGRWRVHEYEVVLLSPES